MAKPIEEMTVAELRLLAEREGVSLTSRMRKAEIVRKLKKALDRGSARMERPQPRVREARNLSSSPRVLVPRSAAPPGKTAAPAAGSAAASATAAPQTAAPPSASRTELSDEYGMNVITLLPRDPDSAFTYWEATERTLEEAYAALGERAPDARLTVRVVEVAPGSSPMMPVGMSFDVEVFHRIGDWSLTLSKPGAVFFTILGVKSRDGRFFEIARSAPARLPRAAASDVVGEEVAEEAERLFVLSGGGRLWSLSSAGGGIGEEVSGRAAWAWVSSPGGGPSGRWGS